MHSLELALIEAAEAWWEEQGEKIPKRGTPEWSSLYEQWHAATLFPVEFTD